MRPFADFPANTLKGLAGVFTDIDDTLTTEGAITPDALQALGELKAAGLKVVAITGRPVGWSLPFAAAWPVDAIVAENGAVALQGGPAIRSAHKVDLQKHYVQNVAVRRANFKRMQDVAARVLRDVPGATLAQDSPGRETDIAIDHSEFAQLSPESIAQVVSIMQSEGMNATVSSIHINGWYGDHNKLQGAHWIVRELLGRDLSQEMQRWAYVGDSTNDQLMFKAFENSIGVANIARFVPELKHLPSYVAAHERGAGFAEVVAHLTSSAR
jgi:hypothetical protein